MTNRTTIKLTLALAGIALFGAGIRMGNNALRWAGLACVAVAWLLRFSKVRSPDAGE
jgi:hypothetical protein